MTSSTDRTHRAPSPPGCRAAGRLRRAPSALAGADRRLCPLRVLPAHLPHVQPVERGDGLTPRPDLPDEVWARGRADDRFHGAALRRLPGLHGLCDRLPVRRPVRQAHRGDQGAGRAEPRPVAGGPHAARRIFALFPYKRRLRLLRGPLRAYQASGLPKCSAAAGCWSDWPRSWPRWRAWRRRSASASRCRPGFRPSGRAAPSSVCSPGACRASSSPASTPRPPVSWPRRAATSSCRRPRAVAAPSRCTTGGSRRPSACASDHRRVREGGRGHRRGERRGLRIEHEGVRRPPRRRPGLRRTGAGLLRRVRDISEYLAELGTVAERHPLEVSVAYHDACHLAHAQGVRLQPRALLGEIPGLEVREIADAASAAAPPGSGTCSTRSRARARRPQGEEHRRDRRRPPGHGQSRLPDAGRRVAGPAGRQCRHGAHHRGPRRLDPRAAGLGARRSLQPPPPSAPGEVRRRMFQQVLDPVGDSLGLSALCAAIPLITLFVLLGGLKVKAWIAGLVAARRRTPRGNRLLRHAGRPSAPVGHGRAPPSASSRSCGSSSTRSGSTTDRRDRALRRLAPLLREGEPRPADPGDHHRVLLRCAAGGAGRIRHPGRHHRGHHHGVGLQADQGRRRCPDRQYGAGRLRCACDADRDPGGGHLGGQRRPRADRRHARRDGGPFTPCSWP